jgi:hypothetical protein
MNYRIWYSTESVADYIIAKTILHTKAHEKKKLFESDASKPNDFHTLPDHIKQILYLDAPDIIVEIDTEPIFSIEFTTEAGTGHNAFQRFARLAASVENNVPAFYVYPEAVIIHRRRARSKWDPINPLVFKALGDVMNIYQIPALLYYFPTDYRTHSNPLLSPNLRKKGIKYDRNSAYAGCPDGSNSEMGLMFNAINEIISVNERYGVIMSRERLLGKRVIQTRKTFMQSEYIAKSGHEEMSPLSATKIVNTQYLLNYLSQFENASYKIGELLQSREETVIYQVDAKFRGDPYPGALAAIDYLLCREGKTFEERKYNLVMAWGKLNIDDTNETFTIAGTKGKINDFVNAVRSSENKNLLSKRYSQLQNRQIPRYYMQVRYGSTFSKVKHIRVFSYFADAILFPDGAVWRDA